MSLVTTTECGFVLDGKPFVPWGTNYFLPHTGWAPQLWGSFNPQRAAEDFARLRDMGANVVRVFTTWKWFLESDTTVNEEGMHRLELLLAIAWQSGIRLLITGPDHWEGMPEFMLGGNNMFFDEPLVRARRYFWREMGRRYQEDDRIFAYYVGNEPWVSAHEAFWTAWQPIARMHAWPERFDALPPDNFLDTEGRVALENLRNKVANEWLEREVTAIRAFNSHTLVSCGFFPMVFPYYAFMSCGVHLAGPSRLLDFLSVHLYPHKPNTVLDYRHELDRMALVASYVASFSKPVLIGEYGTVGGNSETYAAPWGSEYPPSSEELQALWCHDFVLTTSSFVSGWLCWGMYDIPEALDSTRHSGMLAAEGRIKAWGRLFQEMTQQVAAFQPRHPLPRYIFHRDPLVAGLVDPFAGIESWINRRRAEGDFILAESD